MIDSISLSTLQQQIESVIVGQKKLIERMLIAVLANGHILLEGPPGLAKTTAVHALATGVDADFQRIQFTPDLMPSDITGSEIFEPKDGSLKFSAGPLFNQIILADEINRAPPKVQSALLEAMAEQQVSAGNHTHKLDDFFIVLATQNPIEQFGTYALPEALLDRFLFKFLIEYPSQQEEIEIAHRARQDDKGHLDAKVKKILDPNAIFELRKQVNQVYIEPNLEAYAVRLVAATRNLEQLKPEWGNFIKNGASPRGSIALLRAAMAKAFLQQRDYVLPEDIIELAPDVLRHRIILDFSAQAEGINADQIIQTIIDRVEAA
ncbi:MAG: MoxR family ATPase [Gammaproteobacteria bacterium]|nr:MoxR family ATPase [Gammaproteobacteria bacterium]